MARLSLAYRVETHRLAAPFRISGYVFEASDVVVVELGDGGETGRGEAAGVYYLDDDSSNILAELEAHREAIETCGSRHELLERMPAGARATPSIARCGSWRHAASEPPLTK